MATFTQKLIIETFKNMLERMPQEKITVTALVNLPAQMLRTMDGASKTPAVSQTFV